VGHSHSPFLDDPFGRIVHEEVVPSKGDVAEAMNRAEQLVRNGKVRTDGTRG
jgi:hypothetical protein